MNPTENNTPETAPQSRHSTRRFFDHEKLEVYQLLLRFISWVTPLIEEAKTESAGKSREVCDQLDRASLTSLLNTAEGNGKRRGQGRAKFFDDARGSATECAACLDALVAKTVLMPDRILEGKAMLLRIVSMLCGLVDRFDGMAGAYRKDARTNVQNWPGSGPQFKEQPVQYRIRPKASEEPRRRTRTRRRRN